MRLKHIPMIFFSGSIWLIGGVILMSKGLTFLVLSGHGQNPPALMTWIASKMGGMQQASLLLIALGLLIGFLKGRFVLSKAVSRTVYKIVSHPSPVSFREVYGRKEVLLIAVMMGLGFLLRWLPVPMDIRGLISVAVGSALLNGAILFFRQCLLHSHAR